jgi:adenylosuccinate lyase
MSYETLSNSQLREIANLIKIHSEQLFYNNNAMSLKDKLCSLNQHQVRYENALYDLPQFFCLGATNYYRTCVMILQFFYHCRFFKNEFQNKMIITENNNNDIIEKIKNITLDDLCEQLKIEKVVNHDLKAIEYFWQNVFDKIGMSSHKFMIHYLLTSEDVNSIALARQLYDFREYLMKKMYNFIDYLKANAQENKNVTILGYTHCQKASPVLYGRILNYYIERLNNVMKDFENIKFYGKMSGATGGYNAHKFVTKIDDEKYWKEYSREFICDVMGLEHNVNATQIPAYDYIATFLNLTNSFFNIVMDFTKRVGDYILLDYFIVTKVDEEVGSSTMPQKVNPIPIENAHGHMLVIHSICSNMASKMQQTQLDRNMELSTLFRTFGNVFGHVNICLQNLTLGLKKLRFDHEKISRDLENSYEVLSEAVNHKLRSLGCKDSYEIMKKYVRGFKNMTRENYINMLNDLFDSISRELPELNISDQDKRELYELTPSTYNGIYVKNEN